MNQKSNNFEPCGQVSFNPSFAPFETIFVDRPPRNFRCWKRKCFSLDYLSRSQIHSLKSLFPPSDWTSSLLTFRGWRSCTPLPPPAASRSLRKWDPCSSVCARLTVFDGLEEVSQALFQSGDWFKEGEKLFDADVRRPSPTTRPESPSARLSMTAPPLSRRPADCGAAPGCPCALLEASLTFFIFDFKWKNPGHGIELRS